MVVAIWMLLLVPVDVPDTSSPFNTNNTLVMNAANTPGQSFVPRRNGLNRIDLSLAVENPTDRAGAVFRVEEMPFKQVRSVSLRVSDLPFGRAEDFRPGTITERWYSFRFEPVPDTAGKRMFFALEGEDVQGPNSVGLLAFFHNEYPDGEAYLNGSPLNAHIVFRAYTSGRVIDLLGVASENLLIGKPAPFDSLAPFAVLTVLYAGLGALAVISLRSSS